MEGAASLYNIAAFLLKYADEKKRLD